MQLFYDLSVLGAVNYLFKDLPLVCFQPNSIVQQLVLSLSSIETCFIPESISMRSTFDNIISSNLERCRASSQSRASFHSHIGLSNNAISWKLLDYFCVTHRAKNVSSISVKKMARSGPVMMLFSL